MTKQEYDIKNDATQVAEEVQTYGLTIPVIVPTTGDYTLEALKHKLTEYALQLVSTGKNNVEKKRAYSSRIQLLRSLNHNLITAEDLQNDEHLAYLINK